MGTRVRIYYPNPLECLKRLVSEWDGLSDETRKIEAPSDMSQQVWHTAKILPCSKARKTVNNQSI
jgi:hypothetical protein